MTLIKKHHLIATILLLTYNFVNAQDTLITRFINSVYKEVVDSSASYYYLWDTGKNPKFNLSDFQEERFDANYQSLCKEIPVQDFTGTIMADTSKINWCAFNIDRARCADEIHGPKYPFMSNVILKYIPYDTKDSVIKKLESQHVIPVLIKPGMTKKRMKAQEELALKNYQNKPVEEKYQYYFSKPIFSKNKQYVLIDLSNGDHGCSFVFKKVNGKWVKLIQFRCWTS